MMGCMQPPEVPELKDRPQLRDNLVTAWAVLQLATQVRALTLQLGEVGEKIDMTESQLARIEASIDSLVSATEGP